MSRGEYNARRSSVDDVLPEDFEDAATNTRTAAEDFADSSEQTVRNVLPIVGKLEELTPESNYEWNDMGFARLFSDVFGGVCRYNTTAKEWYFYTGTVWKIDYSHVETSRLAKNMTTALIAYSATIKDDKTRTDYVKKAAQYGQLKYRETMIKDSGSNNYITAEMLDREDRYFNCQNGTLDLETMQLLPHDPNRLLSKISNVVYDPAARSELWENTINEIMEADKEKIDYLQRLFGYCLTADTSLERMWILYGPTARNGKSTIVETLLYLMGGDGGYGLTMKPESLAQKTLKDGSRANEDIARLESCRMVNASEPEKRINLNCSLIKTLIGRDTVATRNLYERTRQFTPKFKLLLNTNHLPSVSDLTMFAGQKIVVIEFKHHFDEREQDLQLKNKLRTADNISGVFNWCLEGLKKYKESGLPTPDTIQAAIDEYKHDSDKIALFFEDCMTKSPDNSTVVKVYDQYKTWCSRNNRTPEGKQGFISELISRGLYKKTGTIDGKTVRNVIPGWNLIPELDYPNFA